MHTYIHKESLLTGLLVGLILSHNFTERCFRENLTKQRERNSAFQAMTLPFFNRMATEATYHHGCIWRKKGALL